jgi:hypothetical protein
VRAAGVPEEAATSRFLPAPAIRGTVNSYGLGLPTRGQLSAANGEAWPVDAGDAGTEHAELTMSAAAPRGCRDLARRRPSAGLLAYGFAEGGANSR